MLHHYRKIDSQRIPREPGKHGQNVATEAAMDQLAQVKPGRSSG